MSRSAKGPNVLKPSRDAAREGLRLSLEEFHAVVEEWGATHSAADNSRISSISKRMFPHIITLAADTHEVRDIVDLIGIFSEAANFNPDAIIALVWRILGTFDVKDAAQSDEPEQGPVGQENRSCSKGGLQDAEHSAEAVPRKKRGRPITIPVERKLRALNAGSNKEKAQILFDKKYPTRRELKDVYPLMKNFKKSLPNKTE